MIYFSPCVSALCIYSLLFSFTIREFTFSRDVDLAHILSSFITDSGFINSCCLQWKLQEEKKKKEHIIDIYLSISLFTHQLLQWQSHSTWWCICWMKVPVGWCHYQFNWQLTNSGSQVRLHIRDDLSVFFVPVELWLLLQVGNLPPQHRHRLGTAFETTFDPLVFLQLSIKQRVWILKAVQLPGGVIDPSGGLHAVPPPTPIFSPEGSRSHITPEV